MHPGCQTTRKIEVEVFQTVSHAAQRPERRSYDALAAFVEIVPLPPGRFAPPPLRFSARDFDSPRQASI